MGPENILAVIAGIAATFVGFTGVIFAVGRFASGQWNIAERHALSNLLLPSLVALFTALIPLVALTAVEESTRLWRVMNGLLAIIHLPLVSSALWRALRAELAEPIPLRFVLIPVGYVSVAASAAVALGFFSAFGAAIFSAGLVWFLVIAAVQFVLLIVPAAPQRTAAEDEPGRPE